MASAVESTPEVVLTLFLPSYAHLPPVAADVRDTPSGSDRDRDESGVRTANLLG